MHIENVIIGTPLVHPSEIFAKNMEDWETTEKYMTITTDERRLPIILKELGIVPSVSEVRRNKPELNITLDKPDFLTVKWGKKKIFVLVGV